ncbi:hypothetical protein ACFVQB_27845 [Paenibacillus sp. NPDC057886]|uniref:hypothetical protein n=1 Tax=Paenibacillus sp. NPDC057886 TaxID=3346270 RepID=UPI0036962958
MNEGYLEKNNAIKIVRSNGLFYWYVDPDANNEGIITLHIVSEEKNSKAGPKNI